MFETMNEDQVSKLASALERRIFQKGDRIMNQGDPGEHFYIVEEGDCSCTIKAGDSEQEVKRYGNGELFGEKALLEAAPRAASVTAVGRCKVFSLSRAKFEKLLGPLSQLKAEAYLADPRKLIADFYNKGDDRGPAGTLGAKKLTANAAKQTDGFVVYRPCSRDSIAKMLGKVGVGKGLNVKGKSSKKNRLSGFVPFMQISDNDDKEKVEASPVDARTIIYYRTKAARKEAEDMLNNVWVKSMTLPTIQKITRPEIDHIDSFDVGGSEDVWGLNLPEPLMKQAYIMKPDLTPVVGWETGRNSESAFMNMNMASVRMGAVPDTKQNPKVVLYQFDLADAMNPAGLLIAYEEALVKPVVSDFDTLTVGSRGPMKYEPTPDKQVELIQWSLGHTRTVIEKRKNSPWTSRWLAVPHTEDYCLTARTINMGRSRLSKSLQDVAPE
jgi:hypothetical protein